MGKHNKKLKKLAENNITVLKSGKIKLTDKSDKIDLSVFINDSIDDVVISRLNAIISKEDVVIDTADLHPNISTTLTSQVHTADLAYKANSPDIETLVVTVNKKAALDIFDYLADGTLGEVLRTSTLATIYRKVKPQWVELNSEDNSNFTNILFVPNVMIFIDFSTGKMRKTPIKVNMLIVVEPPVSKMNENGIDKPTTEEAAARIIADIVDASIKCGAKNLIIDPYSHKILRKDPQVTAKLWNQIVTTERYIEQIKGTVFSIENEDLFVTFNANRIMN